jgi:two-component system nitrogen regulation response regulator GlnG
VIDGGARRAAPGDARGDLRNNHSSGLSSLGVHADEKELAVAETTSASVLVVGAVQQHRHAVARWIHDRSDRGAAAWVSISGRLATSDDLAAAFADARGGTCFIDDVGELNELAQMRLLELLDAQPSAPAGVRVIAGSAPGLWDAVVAQRFSSRLFYRVNAIRIDVGV